MPATKPDPATEAAAGAEVSENQKVTDQLVGDLAAAYGAWACVSEARSAQWAADVARRHLDRTVAQGGSQEDLHELLQTHVDDLKRRRPPSESKGRGTAADLKIRPITEQKKGS